MPIRGKTKASPRAQVLLIGVLALLVVFSYIHIFGDKPGVGMYMDTVCKKYGESKADNTYTMQKTLMPVSKTMKQKGEDRTIVIFVYSEISRIHEKNLEFFLKHGIIEGRYNSNNNNNNDNNKQNNNNNNSDLVDYLVITNGCYSVDITSRIAKYNNVALMEKANTCFDFGGWGIGMDYLESIGRLHMYKYFVLLNGSVRGPYIPTYIPKEEFFWPSAFTRRITKETKLIGLTINCDILYTPHVQSMLLVMEADVLGMTREAGFFKCCQSKGEALENELNISMFILNKGYNFDTLEMTAQFTDYRMYVNGTKDMADCRIRDLWNKEDHTMPYELHPFETIFIKTTRKAFPKHLKAYDLYMERKHENNFDSIGEADWSLWGAAHTLKPSYTVVVVVVLTTLFCVCCGFVL